MDLNKVIKERDIPWSRSTLSIKVNSWHSQPDQTSEEGLLHVTELLKRHVLDDRGELVMVSNHDPTLQTIVVVLRVLQQVKQIKPIFFLMFYI